GFARHAAHTLSGKYHDGVHALFSAHDARSSLLQKAAAFGAASLPTGALPALLEETPTYLRQIKEDPAHALLMATPEQRAEREKARQQGEEAAVQAAPGTAVADVAAPLFGGGTATKAGALAATTLPELLGAQQDDLHGQLLWAGVGALMTFGHVPGPLRKLL